MIKIETSGFKKLLGLWNTEGVIFINGERKVLKGIDTYEIILDGNFILHKADVMMGTEKSETFELIQLNKSPEKARMQYFNSNGESGTMKSTLKGTEFRIDGNTIKFRGTITKESTELTGRWYLKKDTEWIDFIELKLTKQI